MWKKEGCPPAPDPLFLERKIIKKLLRKEQNIENAIRRERIAEEIMQSHEHDQHTFHKLIRKQRKTPLSSPTELMVNGKVYEENFIDAWTEHFSNLAVPKSNPHFDEQYKEQVETDVKAIHNLCENISTHHVPITKFEVSKAIDELKNKKAKDEDGLVSENLKLAGPWLSSFLASTINRMVKSRNIPDIIKSGIIHPIQKKGKDINIANNYRGITIISILCKVMDTIQLRHQEAAIPPAKCDTQFSFTKGRSPVQATIVMSELLAEAKDEKKTLVVTSLDIMKAFDVISHAHLLRKLYMAGLPGTWWLLKENSYANMTSKVTWKGKAGNNFTNLQGNRQGGKGSPSDFKEYTYSHIEEMKEHSHGTHIGTIYTGTLACADDIVMTTTTPQEMTSQLGLMVHLNNRDRLSIHPQKTTVNLFNFPKPETNFLTSEQPWSINETPVPVGHCFTHLGIEFDLTSYNGTATATTEARIKTSRATTYSLMGAGLHGENGLSISASLHIFAIYVVPKMLYGLEAIHINNPNMKRLETAHRALLRDIQGLPKRTATPAVYLLSGSLPLEAQIDRRRLRILPSLRDNPTLRAIIHRQIAIKPDKSHSWVVETQALLRKYQLPHICKVVELVNSKVQWKRAVDEAIQEYWSDHIEEEARQKSTLKHLSKLFTINKPHQLWQATGNTVRDVRRATIKGKMLAGTYILQSTRAQFNQTKITVCQMCKEEDEDLPHFLVSCPALRNAREPLLSRIFDQIPKVYQNHPETGWPAERITQLVLDSSHPELMAMLPLSMDLRFRMEKDTRLLCFSLHRARSIALGENK